MPNSEYIAVPLYTVCHCSGSPNNHIRLTADQSHRNPLALLLVEGLTASHVGARVLGILQAISEYVSLAPLSLFLQLLAEGKALSARTIVGTCGTRLS